MSASDHSSSDALCSRLMEALKFKGRGPSLSLFLCVKSTPGSPKSFAGDLTTGKAHVEAGRFNDCLERSVDYDTLTLLLRNGTTATWN